MIHLLALLLIPQVTIPSAPRVARENNIQVHNVDIDDANDHRGKIISVNWDEGGHIGLDNVTAPAGIVILGAGREAQGVSFSPQSSTTYIYDLTITSVMHAAKAVSCESQPDAVYYSDPMPDDGIPGFTYFEDCLFGGKEILNYRVTYIPDVPGLYQDDSGGGRTACKWWVQPKAPRSWGFSGCVFEASQEHALYFHWSHSVRIEDCIFGADGGCAIQAVWRYGRPDTGAYHGNPSMSPPAHGDFICIRSEFRDYDIWSREASALTVVGWVQGDVYLEDLTFSGSRGAIALWTDSFKGQYSRGTNGDTYAHILGVDEFGDEDIQVYPGGEVVITPNAEDLVGMPFNRVSLNRITVLASPNHSREQIMLTGARSYDLRDITVNSFKPKLIIGAEGGGHWKYHRTTVGLSRTIPTPKYWDGSRYQTGLPGEYPEYWDVRRAATGGRGGQR